MLLLYTFWLVFVVFSYPVRWHLVCWLRTIKLLVFFLYNSFFSAKKSLLKDKYIFDDFLFVLVPGGISLGWRIRTDTLVYRCRWVIYIYLVCINTRPVPRTRKGWWIIVHMTHTWYTFYIMASMASNFLQVSKWRNNKRRSTKRKPHDSKSSKQTTSARSGLLLYWCCYRCILPILVLRIQSIYEV